MVKADAKRDYYADLELSPTADTEEIKKQFRLLAKQYHPDRNPGHEVEFVPKFQAVQAAHEILADPTERTKYDNARAKLARTNVPPPPPTQPAPQPRDGDPYNFRKPSYRPSPQGTTTSNTAPPPPQSTSRQRPPFVQKPQSSVGAEKFNVFTRPGPQWDRARYEEAARAEAAQRFQNMRPAQNTQMPPPPPRPARQHPTAPRPQAVPSPDLPNAPNGVPPGFPGLSRTASGRRTYQGTSVDDPTGQRTSAYAYVRADRAPPTTAAQNYTPEAYGGYSPPTTKSRPAASPLRHTKSHDQGNSERPFLGRTTSKYASNIGERTDIHSPGLGRSASVRGSPVERRWEDTGPFGRPHSQTNPPPRHHSESPKARPETSGTYAEQSSSSGSSGEEGQDIHNRQKARPRVRRGRATTNDGLEGQFPNTNYTRVKTDTSEPYAYPPPQSKHPTREPFPDMTSPDDVVPPGDTFSNAEPRRPVPETIFHPAKFSAEDWADKLRNMSPTKRGSKSKKHPNSRSDHSPDAMDVDPAYTNHEKPVHTNGVNLEDLKKEGPFASTGLEGFDDLATSLPFQSRPAGKVNLETNASARLRSLNLPRPPRTVIPPAEDRLTQETWQQYVRNMNMYMREWSNFQAKMIAHFQARHEIVDHGMCDNWISKASDGPDATEVDMNGAIGPNGVPRAGYAAYMSWLDDDQKCHAWWDRAAEDHRACLEELGRVRSVIKSDLS